MVLFNYSTKELTAKVVYYGPGLCGKTTNLQWIHEKLPIRNKGKMLSLATEADRTLFFDFLPIELGSIRGMKTRIQLYTVPGQVFYNATRRMVLKGADCVVFVADSQEAMLDADLDSLANLRENLEVNELDADEIPMVLQYNKRDLPNALPVAVLNQKLNPRGLPFFEAQARNGIGVEETLKGATTLVFKSLAGKYGGEAVPARPGGPGTLPPGAARPAVPASAPAPAPAPVKAPAPAAAKPPAPAPRPAPPPPPPPAAIALDDAPALDLEDFGSPAAPSAQSTDDLLDSLELGDSPSSPPAAEISLGDGGEMAMEELEVMPDDLEEAPPSAPPARPGSATMASQPSDGEDLRRRVGRPQPSAALALEDDAEEISFESPAPAPAPAPRPAARAPEGDTNPGARSTSTRPSPAPAIVPAPAPAAAPAPAPAAAKPAPRPAEPAPVSIPVEVTAAPGQREVTVPIEVTVGREGAEVHLKLNIALRIRISD
jgi:mutual gliding-motility protein MglA